MFIGIDGNEANIEHRVGSNIYAHRILQGLHDLDFRTDYQVYLKSVPIIDFPKKNTHWHYRVFGPSRLWTQWRLPLDLYMDKNKPALFFTPGHYAPRFSPIPTVIAIMDLAFLYYPEGFQPKVLRQLRSWTQYSVKNASHILAISESTKKDIVYNYGIKPEKITVTHLGPNIVKPQDWNQAEKDLIHHKYKIPGKYFVFIGTRQPRKNLVRLINAFNYVRARERNIFLVIVGKTWHQFSQQDLDLNANIIVTGFVPNADLPKLIMGAEALVLPSLYEGFGIPVLEAMNLGTLVAASNVSSIPEITGHSPYLFKPTDEKAIANTLVKILQTDSVIKKKLIREGKIRAKIFTWEQCVKTTMNVLHRISV